VVNAALTYAADAFLWGALIGLILYAVVENRVHHPWD
jgi:hypothetical protein